MEERKKERRKKERKKGLVSLEFGGELDLAAGEDAQVAGPVLEAGEAEGELVIAGGNLECGGSGTDELTIEIDFGGGRIGLQRDGGRGEVGLGGGNKFAVFEEDHQRGIVQPGLRFEVYFALRSTESGDDLLARHAGSERGGSGRRGHYDGSRNCGWSRCGCGSRG